MALEIKHTKVSAKANGLDATLVQPSDWNAVHAITLAANSLIGRDGSAGAALEIACTAFARGILASNDLAAFLTATGMGTFTTGDVKLTIKQSADTGWVMCNDGTIGNAVSGGTTRANADCLQLFLVLYGLSDTWAPVSGGRTGNGTNDFNAGKTIRLTRMLGRALAISGSGTGLSARTLGEYLGAETHALTDNELGPHNHGGVTGNGGAHSHTLSGYGNAADIVEGAGVGVFQGGVGSVSTTSVADHSHTIPIAGLGTPHNNMQPSAFLNAMIKL